MAWRRVRSRIRSDGHASSASPLPADGAAASAAASADPLAAPALAAARARAREARLVIEAAWIVLLVFAASARRMRPIAGVLALKWGVSYLAFGVVGEFAPAVTDILVGSLGVAVAASLRTARGDLVAGLFVVTALIHAAYWLAWEVGLWLPLTYYYALLMTYTLQVVLICPWERVNVRRLVDRVRRGGLASGVAPGYGRSAARDRTGQ